MKNTMVVSPSPFVTKKGNSTRRIMIDVIIAMSPMIVCAVVFFGFISLALVLVATLAAVGAELVYNVLYTMAKGKKVDRKLLLKGSHTDCSAAVTGILVALNLPAAFPLWAAALGSIFAIILVKMIFGGIGKNFANPALVARIFLFVSFGAFFAASSNNFIDGDVTATWLSGRNGNLFFMFNGDRVTGEVYLLDMIVGVKNSAAIGEVSALAILIGFVYLLVRKVIDFKLPLYIVGGTLVFSFLFDGIGRVEDLGALNALVMLPLAHIFTGGLLMGAVFMATDYSTSPNTNLGRLLFGLGIALISVVIRVYGSYPEGVSFAILFMNILVPVLDKLIVPKPFGRAERLLMDKAKEEQQAKEVKA